MRLPEQAKRTSERVPPGPRRVFPLAGLLRYRRGPLPFFQNLARHHGDISYFKLGPQPAFFLNHPDLIKGFAWMEGVLLLATLAQQWKMRLAPSQVVALRPVITLRPKHGMRMTLIRKHLGMKTSQTDLLTD